VLVEAENLAEFPVARARFENPVFLANARLSNRSFRGYKRFGFLFRPLFASFRRRRLPERGGRRALRKSAAGPKPSRLSAI